MMGGSSSLLENAVALVTGATSGIGRGIALTLASHGALVVVSDIDIDAAETFAGDVRRAYGRAGAIALDVRDWEHESAAITHSAELANGPIDILVNSAGLYLSTPFHELSPQAHEN